MVWREERAAQIRNFVFAQQRPADNVTEATLWQMHNLREDGFGFARLFLAQITHDMLLQHVVGVTETSEQRRSRWTTGAFDQHAKLASVQRRLRGSRDNGLNSKAIRQWQLIFRGDGFQL